MSKKTGTNGPRTGRPTEWRGIGRPTEWRR
jgi:hypothetical protein